MRIAVAHPQTPFVRGGAETHTEALVRHLREAGHQAEKVTVAGKWYPATELLHQMAVWRALDLSESNGLEIDMVIALKFPAYLVKHERKVVWLIHQHRSAYELWDHPEFADLGKQVEGPELAGKRVIVVEDTSTTGGSPLKAIEALRKVGAEVVAVAVVVDRATGAREVIEAAGVPYLAAIGLEDLGLD